MLPVRLSAMMIWPRLWIPVMSGFQVELGLKTAIYRQMKRPVI